MWSAASQSTDSTDHTGCADRWCSSSPDPRHPRSRWVSFSRSGAGLAVFLAPLLAAAALCPGQQKAPERAAATQPASRPSVPKIAVLPTPQTTEQEILARIQQTKDAGGIKEDERKAVLALYTQALEQIRSAKEFTDKAKAFEQAVKDAPEQLRRFAEAASQPATQPAVRIPQDLSLAEMEAKLKQFQLELTDLTKTATALAGELKDRQARRAQLPERLSEAQAKLKDAEGKLAALAASTDPPRVKDARQALLKATQEALRAEIDAYQRDMATDEMRGALLRAQQGALARQTSRAQAIIKAWQEAVHRRRDEETRRQLAAARRAEREAAQKHPVVQNVTRRNRALAELRAGPEGLTAKQKTVSQSLQAANSQRTKLEKSLERVQKMVAEGISADLVAILLRQHRAELPDIRAYRQRAAARRAEISQARLKLMELNELALRCSDVAAQAQRLVASAEPPVPAHRRQDVREQVQEALQDCKQLVEPLIKEYESYANVLLELNTAERKLVAVTEEFADYIGERILWTRSTSPLELSDLVRCAAALAWLADADSWKEMPSALWAGFRNRLLGTVLVLLVLAALLTFRRRLVALMVAHPKGHSARGGAGFWHSVHQLLLAAGLAVVAPGAMWLVGWLLVSAGARTVLPFALGRGLVVTAGVWLPLALLRKICRKGGLAAAQFGWSADGLARIRRCLFVLAAAGLPLVFLHAVMEAQDNAAHRDSLGRLALMAALVIAAIWLGRLLHPRGRLVRNSRAARERRWAYRLRLVWYPLIVGAPPALAVAAAAGYHYTAAHLGGRLWMQAWLVVGLVMLQALFERWIRAARQRLAQRAQARRGLLAPAAAGRGPAVADAAIKAQEEELDASTMDAQTSQFARYVIAAMLIVGIWVIWGEVLPALNILRRVELWTVSADGTRAAVTLAHLLGAILVFVLTVVAGRNIPGMLEITLLQRLRVDAGVRYAVTRLARYAISVVGVVIALNLIGVKWQHVQWLVAAMTVGLGFGLQEIFGNFISGLILLFERPIRVGDVVTVGETTGTVTRIRIRATTITNWDRKELVVPNKEFITGRLVNWSLSDQTLRLRIPVSIVYGSDTQLAKEKLLRVAQENPNVLDDPAPQALLLKFSELSPKPVKRA